MARKRPTRINFFRSASGNLLAKIEIKIILSIPKMISRNVNVKKAKIRSGVNMLS